VVRETDAGLVRAASGGDMGAFALLSERHRGALRATAISLLGYTDEAEDAVQEALITALRRLPALRDPEAAGPWLKAIVRNACRSQLRARRPVLVAELEPLLPPDSDLLPEELLDRAGTRDWVRHAMASLPAGVREVMLLRYFSGLSAYAMIAQLCGVPVETVASRLRDGRRALARRLRETAEEAHADSARETESWRRESVQLVAAMGDGSFDAVVRDWYHPRAEVHVLGGLRGDRSVLLEMMDYTLGAGVGARLHDVAASRDTLIWETDFLNPPSDPDHCPPGMAALFRLHEGRVVRMGIAYRT
jgi:RNA polymerase sigma factor (sigma-70 family)